MSSIANQTNDDSLGTLIASGNPVPSSPSTIYTATQKCKVLLHADQDQLFVSINKTADNTNSDLRTSDSYGWCSSHASNYDYSLLASKVRMITRQDVLIELNKGDYLSAGGSYGNRTLKYRVYA